MPHFHIHWKGSPHHHLPHIRSASVGSRTFAQTATEEVLRRPLSPALEQERAKQRTAGQERKGRSPARTAAGQKEHNKENPKSLRRSTPPIYLASKLGSKEAGLKYSRIRNRSLSPSRNTRGRSRSATGFRTTIETDGPSIFSSTISKPGQGGDKYSAVNTYNTLDYWTSNPSTSIYKSSENQNTWDPVVTARSAALDGGTTQSQAQTKTASWGRIYDPRIDSHQGIKSNHGFVVVAGDSYSSNPRIIITKPVFSSEEDNRETSGEGGVWETLDSNREHSDSTQSRARSTLSSLQNFESGVIFRTPSQTKALKRFTKELDLHWQAVRFLPKQTILASPSITTVSADTIGEFLPFHAEFQSAGLSITSKEQGRLSSNHAGHMPSLPPPSRGKSGTLANKEHKTRWTGSNVRISSAKFIGNDGPSSSIGSASTGTTIIGFTPPHEKHLARRTNSRRKYSSASTASIGFTPPHELYIPKQPPTRPAPITPTRTSIPWLRKADQSSKAPPSAAKVSSNCTFANCKKPHSSKQIAPEVEAEENSDHLAFTPLAPQIWQNAKCENGKSSQQVPSPPYKQTYEVAIQTEPLFPNAPPGGPILYSDVGTQTAFSPFLSPHFRSKPDIIDEKTEIWKNPMFSGRNKIPLITSNSESVQNIEVETKLPQKLQRTRTKHDHETQTPENDYFSIPNQTRSHSSSHRHVSSGKQQHGGHDFLLHGLWPLGKISQIHGKPETARNSSFTRQLPLVVSQYTQGDGRQGDEAGALYDQIPSNPDSFEKARPPILCQQCNYFKSERQTDIPPEVVHENKDTLHTQRPPRAQDHSAKPLCSSKDHENAQREEPTQQSHEDNAIDEYARRYSVEDPVKRDHRPQIKPIISPPFIGLPKSSQHYTPPRREGYHSHHPLLGHRHLNHNQKHAHSQKVAQHHISSQHDSRKHHHYHQQPIVSQQTHVVNSNSGALSHGTYFPDQCVCTDPQVFHGLHIAAVACCDSTVDGWVEEVTGLGVRSYLADLSRFDALGVNSLATAAKISARQRGIQYREYQQAKGGNLSHMGDAVNLSFMDDRMRAGSGYPRENPGEAKELRRRMNFAVGLESVMSSPQNGGHRSERELINNMKEWKEERRKESMEGRAKAMGWRERCISDRV
ncbi:hypothetical protein BGZ60DRAFT_531686 [Tricladium varicosporioides]|nr:hypothetical protein BGZ60DRAFT_531686 [Hymenoscyphus varicosporioides]